MTSPQFLDPSTGTTYPLDSGLWRSPTGAPFMLTPMEGLRRDQIVTNDRSMWRYRAALPVDLDPPVSLGEGCTPLIASTFQGNQMMSLRRGSLVPVGSSMAAEKA